MNNTNNAPVKENPLRVVGTVGRHLKKFTASYGIELDPIARSLHIDPAAFTNFDSYIGLDNFCRLLETLAAMSADDTFGLKYGQYFKPGSTGAFGYGLANAPTIKHALEFMVEYRPVHVDSRTLQLEIETDQAVLKLSYSPLIVQKEQFSDFTISIMVRTLRRYAGSQFRLLSAQLERTAPRDKSLHADTFSRCAQFDADINKIAMPPELLKIENPNADPVLFDYMKRQCEMLLNERTHVKDIVALLKDELTTNMENDDRAIGDMARRLGMSERTLQRRLSELGTNFWSVFEATREEVSLHLLQNTDVALLEISRRLGYSSQSAYTRAVKRWHGLSPARLRQQRQTA